MKTIYISNSFGFHPCWLLNHWKDRCFCPYSIKEPEQLPSYMTFLELPESWGHWPQVQGKTMALGRYKRWTHALTQSRHDPGIYKKSSATETIGEDQVWPGETAWSPWEHQKLEESVSPCMSFLSKPHQVLAEKIGKSPEKYPLQGRPRRKATATWEGQETLPTHFSWSSCADQQPVCKERGNGHCWS